MKGRGRKEKGGEARKGEGRGRGSPQLTEFPPGWGTKINTGQAASVGEWVGL